MAANISALNEFTQNALALSNHLLNDLGELEKFVDFELENSEESWLKLNDTLATLQGVLSQMEQYTSMEKEQSSFHLEQDELKSWQKVAGGGFSSVFTARHKGSLVAIKVLKKSKHKLQILEGTLLRNLGHENIVAFRGIGKLSSPLSGIKFSNQHFIVMEYVPDTVHRYVGRRSTYESKGLSPSVVWDFARQIANGLAYLHTLSEPTAHRDLKPDNLLLDPSSLKIKLADFGLALSDIYGGENQEFNLRWASPELWEEYLLQIDSCADESQYSPEETYPSFDTAYYMSADVYAYGLVLAFCLTGELPWGSLVTTNTLNGKANYSYLESLIRIPETLSKDDPLRRLISGCNQKKREDRFSSAEEIVGYFFRDQVNPYLKDAASAEFFCCGFMKDTSIFVADSLVDEKSEGYNQTQAEPIGYPANCLVCEVDTTPKEGKRFPVENNWDRESMYRDGYSKFKKQAHEGHIDDNPTVPLRSLDPTREGLEEKQEVNLTFVQGTYVHHRAMRDIWRSLSEEEKSQALPCKLTVSPAYSTSFGLHVAIITADPQPRFLFCRRSIKVGMSSPGKFTCGAVESVSVKDYVTLPEHPEKTFVSLLKTAARGLFEELRIELKEEEFGAICLSTIYLKYDTHEWGLCGFVDLNDKRIAPERRLTAEIIRSRFTSGPKDKFEHKDIHDVDFTMDSMMKFIQENQNDFASSGKLVAVKVMQAFFGLLAVEHAFSAALNPTQD